MYTNGNVPKLLVEVVRIVYIKKTVELELIIKEEESGWVTVIPLINGKQGHSFTCVNMETALKETSKRYNLPDLKQEDFSVSVESTDFAGVTL